MPNALTYMNYLRDEGYHVDHVVSGKNALAVLTKNIPDIILLDLHLPDIDGMEILIALAKQGHAKKAIVMTANSSINSAVKAVGLGAYDFLSKPFGRERLLVTIKNFIQHQSQYTTLETLRKQTAYSAPVGAFIGSSAVMKSLYQTLNNIAQSDAAVMISGEPGTGKRVCAKALHKLSARKSHQFVALNCTAIPKDLLESELFGHVRGAFTEAIENKMGAAMRADGGVLFLDEICELEFNLQAKLLRFLQTNIVQPVGGDKPHRIDTRILAATNRDPLQEIAAGRFREDLYYRLNVIPVHMPPLRNREDDVIEIALHFLERFRKQEKKPFHSISPEAQEMLRRYTWPGNVRELYHCIQRIVALHNDEVVQADMLKPILENHPCKNLAPKLEHSGGETKLPLKPLREIEMDYIREALRASNQNVPQAAILLDISPSTIYRRLKELKDDALMGYVA